MLGPDTPDIPPTTPGETGVFESGNGTPCTEPSVPLREIPIPLVAADDKLVGVEGVKPGCCGGGE